MAGMVRFEWDRLRWFEEDEPIYGHPRNPYARVDALRSHRHIQVQLDGIGEHGAVELQTDVAVRAQRVDTGVRIARMSVDRLVLLEPAHRSHSKRTVPATGPSSKTRAAFSCVWPAPTRECSRDEPN